MIFIASCFADAILKQPAILIYIFHSCNFENFGSKISCSLLTDEKIPKNDFGGIIFLNCDIENWSWDHFFHSLIAAASRYACFLQEKFIGKPQEIWYLFYFSLESNKKYFLGSIKCATSGLLPFRSDCFLSRNLSRKLEEMLFFITWLWNPVVSRKLLKQYHTNIKFFSYYLALKCWLFSVIKLEWTAPGNVLLYLILRWSKK